MPDGHEHENSQVRDDRVGRAGERPKVGPAQRDVDVPQTPPVKRAVPGAPERQCAVVVADAPQHVLGRVDAVHERPEAEKAPWHQQLEPDDVQLEEGQQGNLRGRVRGPVRPRVGDGVGVVEVQHELHGEEHEKAPDAVLDGARELNAGGLVPALRDVVVKGQDRAGQVEGRIDRVGKVVAEGVGAFGRGGADSVAFGEVGRV